MSIRGTSVCEFSAFRDAVKKIAEYGHSEEDAEQVVLRRGFCHGDKDAVSNMVECALPFLGRKQEVHLSKYQVFDNVQSMQHLVEYSVMEMVNSLREIKPSLSVSEAMWSLLVCDLNMNKACAMETDVLSGLCNKEIQHWSDWTTAMVRQAAQRLGKDKEELKTLRQEKEEEEKLMKDKQMHHPVITKDKIYL